MGGMDRVSCGLVIAGTMEVWAPACGMEGAVGTGFAVTIVLEPPIIGTAGTSFRIVAMKERFIAAQSFGQCALSKDIPVVADAITRWVCLQGGIAGGLFVKG
jgi:hypothetical protein